MVWNAIPGLGCVLMRRTPRRQPDRLHVWRVEGVVRPHLDTFLLPVPREVRAMPGRLAVDLLDLLSPADEARLRLGSTEFAFFRSPYNWRDKGLDKWHTGFIARSTEGGEWETIHYFGASSGAEIEAVVAQAHCPFALIALNRMPELRRPEDY